MNEQWLLLTTPTQRAAFNLSVESTDGHRDNLINAARVLVNFPPNDDWAQDRSLGYFSTISEGCPGRADQPLVIALEADRTNPDQYLDRTNDLAGISAHDIADHLSARAGTA